jgi:hypothetical protein
MKIAIVTGGSRTRTITISPPSPRFCKNLETGPIG